MTHEQTPVIVWFRDDLRLADNPALYTAAALKQPLICIYVHDEESPGLRNLGGASKWWLHGALDALNEALAVKGAELVLMRGAALDVLEALAAETKAGAVYWNRRYGEAGRAIDTKLKAALKARGIAVESFNANLLHEPWTVMNKSMAPFRVFSAYWRAARGQGEPEAPLPAPLELTQFALPQKVRGACVALTGLQLLPEKPDWAGGFREIWTLSETTAQEMLMHFLEKNLYRYPVGRDCPGENATSMLSPYMHFGQISPRQIWHAAKDACATDKTGASEKDLEKYLSEIGWREFSYHLLFHNPDLAKTNFQPRFDAMPWRSDSKALRAWQRGQTGYPIVDAGMRQLWHIGWMHNRVRMVTASFLVKHLLIDWREGEEWFWDTLADADDANNAASWQWVAGSGADAAPYFRIFNPVLQGEKFDTDGTYIKRWVPELAHLPASLIHKPWKATPMQLHEAGVTLGETYPHPIVDHDMARRRALESFKVING